MARVVVLDTGPLGLLCGAVGRPESNRCRAWLADCDEAGLWVVVPEIADYELRREILLNRRRGHPVPSLDALDRLCVGLRYAAITTEALHVAAQFWAGVRHRGQPTADRHALDGDAILAAQAVCFGAGVHEVIIASTNVGQLGRFPGIDARPWGDIEP